MSDMKWSRRSPRQPIILSQCRTADAISFRYEQPLRCRACFASREDGLACGDAADALVSLAADVGMLSYAFARLRRARIYA